MADGATEGLKKPSEALPRSARPEELHKTADPRPHLAVLDALRGIAILGIVLNHATLGWAISTRTPLNIPLTDTNLGLHVNAWGPFCLVLFFLLSGYLLTWTEGRRASKGDYSLRSYAFRRALRLVPAYYTALALILLLRITNLQEGPDPTFWSTPIYLLVLQGLVPIPQLFMGFDLAYWYLTSEVAFYALLPVLVLKIRGLYGRLALFGALVAIGATTYIIMYVTSINAEITTTSTYLEALFGFLPFYLMTFPLTHLWIFMAGVLLRELVERLNEKRPGGSWPALSFSLFASSLAITFLLPFVPFFDEVGLTGAFKDHTPILFVPAVAFFVAAILGSPVLSRILSWRMLGFIGMISYSLFLIHGTVILLVGEHLLRRARPLLRQLDGAATWIAFAGYFGFTLVVAGVLAYLGYRYIESPFLRHKPD